MASPYEGENLNEPDTSTLDASEFASSIRHAIGAGIAGRNIPEYNVTTMILKREQGLCTYNRFSSTNKCNLANRYLPNEMLPLQTYRDIYSGEFCGFFSKDGDYFVATSRHLHKSKFRLYKSYKNVYKLINSLDGSDGEFSMVDLAFTRDHRDFVYATSSGNLYMCSVQGFSNKEQPLCLINTNELYHTICVIFSPDEREILNGASDGCIYVYDRETNEGTLRIKAHQNNVNTLAFADESSDIFYSGGNDALINVWDRRSLNESYPKPVGMLSGHRHSITYIDSRGDGRHLISNSKDHSIKLWDMRVFSVQNPLHNALKYLHGHTFMKLLRWRECPEVLHHSKNKLPGDTSIMTYKGHAVDETLVRCRFSPVTTTGQRYIYTGCATGWVLIYDVLTGKTKQVLDGHSRCVIDVAWHPYKNEIVTSGEDGVVARWIYRRKELL